MWSPRKEEGRKGWGFWVEDESVPNSSFSSKSERGFAVGGTELGADADIGSPLARAALQSNPYDAEYSVEAERDSIMKNLHCFVTENEQLKKPILEKGTGIKDVSIHLLDVELKVVIIESRRTRLSESI